MNESAQLTSVLMEHVRESGPMLFRVAYRILHDRDAAEDACQQAFLKGLQMSEPLRDQAAARAWLTRVVINESLDVLRKRKREKAMHLAHPAEDGSQGVDQFELRESVVAALAELDPQTQTVVTLRLMHGMSGNQVKEALGCSAAQVSRRLHEGIDALRVLLRDERAIVNR